MPTSKPQVSKDVEGQLKKFKNWLLKKGRAENTAELYQSYLRRVISEEGINDLEDALLLKRAPKYLRVIRAALISWGRFNNNADFVKSVKEIKLPPPRRLKDEQPLTQDEWRLFLDTVNGSDLDSPLRSVLAIVAIRGFRIGDVLRLTKGQIKEALKKGQTNFQLKGGQRKTFNVVRFKKQLEDLYRYGEDEGNWNDEDTVADLISNTSRDDYSAAYVKCVRAVKKTFKDAGLDADRSHLHLLRATLASHYYNLSKDIVKLKEYMGWEKLETAAGYVNRFKMEDLEAEASKLDEIMGP